ncbi:hypothetical protein [Corallococcus exercitus]|uniref:Uncharacterized protein n=1 Tax=Corallococcus exercitus TaxID=2316736 RepID=A0A7Y4JX83_9BACT|nr:hypothetical protein [Corallococcus exercitus]NOK12779.1 hypothetical protein [Corallococcus exercitus]
MALVYRKLHSGRARTIPELYRELKEWTEETSAPKLGYSLTFLIEDEGSARSAPAGRFNLHEDARREAIQIFIELYREPPSAGGIFKIDRTASNASKRCVRLNSEKLAAKSFYNHSEEPRPANTAPQPANTSAVQVIRRRPPYRHPAASAPAAMEVELARRLLTEQCVRCTQVRNWEDWHAFRTSSQHQNWVYFVRFGVAIFAWGTASGKGARLRATSLFHAKLSGKYDRRVDYLMLKILHGEPDVWVFEVEDAKRTEDLLRARVGNRYCFGGIPAADRREVSKIIFSELQKSAHWQGQSSETQRLFLRYLAEVYFAGLSHPGDAGRTFHFGDSLEPGFIERTLGKPELIPAIEAVLQVRF